MAGAWDRVLAFLRREKRDVDEALGEFETRANAALDRRERELRATPEERVELEQQRGAEIDDEFDAVRRRIEGSSSGEAGP